MLSNLKIKQQTNNSENLIIHFTSEFNFLKSILTSNSLKVCFSCEDFIFNGKYISKSAHPMISFSEYNPDEINSKKITYGNYGIGFSKEWSRNNKIGPVFYVEQSSLAAKGLKELLAARRKTNNEKLPGKIRLAIMELKAFIKNERGFNSYNNQADFDFKSENEWRFVPKKSQIDNYLISQNQKTYLKNKKRHNKMLEKYPLKFNLSDVRILYVSSDSEKDELIRQFGIIKDKIYIAGWKKK